MSRIIIDLHCHTREKSYDGRVGAAHIARELHRSGFSGVVFTDHSNVWNLEELDELRQKAEVPSDFVLLSGQEVRVTVDDKTAGDLLVYGLTESRADGTPAQQIFEEIVEVDGFCIAAHPSVRRIGFGPHLENFPVLAAEAWNGRYGQRVATASEALATKHGLPKTGGSDSHVPEDVGGGGTEFPELPKTLQEIKALIKANNCRAWKPSVTARMVQWLKREQEG